MCTCTSFYKIYIFSTVCLELISTYGRFVATYKLEINLMLFLPGDRKLKDTPVPSLVISHTTNYINLEKFFYYNSFKSGEHIKAMWMRCNHDHVVIMARADASTNGPNAWALSWRFTQETRSTPKRKSVFKKNMTPPIIGQWTKQKPEGQDRTNSHAITFWAYTSRKVWSQVHSSPMPEINLRMRPWTVLSKALVRSSTTQIHSSYPLPSADCSLMWPKPFLSHLKKYTSTYW